MKKEFWKGFGVALALVLIWNVAWRPFCTIIPWQLLPFQVNLDRGTKTALVESYLEKYYVEDYSKEDVENMLYAGMLSGVGDPYTYYLTEENLTQHMDHTNGQFGGIGIEAFTTAEGEIMVSRVVEDNPAKLAGMQEGDIIIGVDGEDVRGRRLADVAARIRGKDGTEVTIQVLRKSSGETQTYTVKRAIVVVESVESRMLDEEMGYIALRAFKDNTYDQFQSAMESLEQQGMKGLVLDLRDNPGGLVRSVYEIGEELLPAGTMVYTMDKEENRSDLRCDEEYSDIPLVVLINENSASASEIFAGAVKDMERGTLVGSTTFGKGLVQRLFPLPDGSALNVTVQKYYTPKGTSIHGIGVVPDREVGVPKKYEGTTTSVIPMEEDLQLQAAMEELGKKLQ